MDLEAALLVFLEEADELLGRMEEALLGLETAHDARARIDEIFRAAHTIKGTSGVFGFDEVVAFTHDVESVLDRARDSKIDVDSECIGLLLRCKDHIARLVGCVAEGREPDGPTRSAGGELSADLRRLLSEETATPRASAAELIDEVEGGERLWYVGVRFGTDVLRGGMDPLSFLRFLLTRGDAQAVRWRDTLPAWSDFDPESCYVGFDILLLTRDTQAQIEGAFEFVRDECRLQVVPSDVTAPCVCDAAALLDADPSSLVTWLNARGVGLAAQTPDIVSTAEALPMGGDAAAGSTAPNPSSARETRSLRVDADKLDRLIELVGELVVASAGVQNVSQHLSEPRLVEANELLSRLVDEVRDQALSLRMVQIGPTFQRFQRVVRDVSRELAKEIELHVGGADTELDKTVVERIGDPLMHLVRNAMDHGIEPAEVRRAAGKPERARIALDACHEAGGILITVSDDGGGLNRQKILSKAIERGLVAPDAVLAERDIDRLIFEPGFSTADRISNLSGRGVGMDVVRRDIEALRGTVDIDSEPGAGTRIRIRLPLTLAIIDGFLIGVDDARFVLPVDLIVECVELAGSGRLAARSRGYLDLRGEVLPLMWLRDLFDMSGDPPMRRENIVVVHFGAQKVGLVVDQLIGEHQTVIRPLGRMFRGLRGVGGSTILGDGDIALVLDLPDLTQFAAADRRVVERMSFADAA
ncbi:chemotaxis protein CheA [Methyloversatilis discipulorum]|uniref:chemotaxis protein CheA n=1 Tax=Methyloversatilis discipulorum TaxID=1119528 RepID=UPI001A55F48E|nr:chemotaxis protein CheA [Methyloversatilis discipulorum]MBL8469264.1 chemotaxis protein CheA [Methyloversatilis discipulorum]